MDRLSAMKLGVETSKLHKNQHFMQQYKIQKVGGEDKAVYQIIAPVVMSKEGMKYFDNYPVTTSKDHVFYILTYDKDLCGFASIVPNKTIYAIRNVYVNNARNANVSFNNLIKAVLEGFDESDFYQANITCMNADIPLLKEKGFKMQKEGKNWSVMHKTKKS